MLEIIIVSCFAIPLFLWLFNIISWNTCCKAAFPFLLISWYPVKYTIIGCYLILKMTYFMCKKLILWRFFKMKQTFFMFLLLLLLLTGCSNPFRHVQDWHSFVGGILFLGATIIILSRKTPTYLIPVFAILIAIYFVLVPKLF